MKKIYLLFLLILTFCSNVEEKNLKPITVKDFKEFVNAIKKSKPDSIKGKFINKVYLSTSMSPSIRIENIK